MNQTLLIRILGFEQKKNFEQALIFYLFYLLVSLILMLLLFIFSIIAKSAFGEACELTYSITRIAIPIIMILISSYICYKRNILDRISFILLILLSAFSSLFFLTLSGLFVPAYLTTK